jgi:hypothetical protein
MQLKKNARTIKHELPVRYEDERRDRSQKKNYSALDLRDHSSLYSGHQSLDNIHKSPIRVDSAQTLNFKYKLKGS